MTIQPRRACECGGARKIMIRAARSGPEFQFYCIIIIILSRVHSLTLRLTSTAVDAKNVSFTLMFSFAIPQSVYVFGENESENTLPSIPDCVFGRTLFEMNDETLAQIPTRQRMYIVQ